MVLPSDDEILMALDECGLRWVAWQRALADLGPDPDDDTWLAVIDLELAADRRRERLLVLLAQRGWTIGDVLEEPAA